MRCGRRAYWRVGNQCGAVECFARKGSRGADDLDRVSYPRDRVGDNQQVLLGIEVDRGIVGKRDVLQIDRGSRRRCHASDRAGEFRRIAENEDAGVGRLG